MKPFPFSGGTYEYHKTTQKLTKVYERFLRILLQLCRSRFRLIISEQKFRCKSQGTGDEKELFRMQSGMQIKYGGDKPLQLNVKTSKIAGNRKNAKK